MSIEELSLWQWGLVSCAAFFIGVSKAGFSGISLLSVFLLADVFGARASVGIALPMLIAADLSVYRVYRKHASWRPVWRVLLPSLLGVVLGWLVLGKIDDLVARRSMGVIIVGLLLLQWGRGRLRLGSATRKGGQIGGKSPMRVRIFTIFVGVVAGVASTLANAAGPIVSIFLLMVGFPKMELLGIAARFFLLLNLFKLPFSAELGLISGSTLMINLCLIPVIWLGIAVGRWGIGRVSQRGFVMLITVFAAVAAIRLLWF